MPDSTPKLPGHPQPPPGKIMGPERRRAERYPFSGSAEVIELKSQARATGRCSDLGPGGCYVDTISPLPVGTTARIRIIHEESTFEAIAKVSYSLVALGMGLSFSEVREDAQAVLRDWIFEISGGASVSSAAAHSTQQAGKSAPGTGSVEHVINELVSLMARKKMLSEDEAAELLRHLHR